MGGDWTIGRVALEAGVGVETVRFYQRAGLIATPPRPAGGRRRYAPAAARRIRFIKRAQRLGFTLEEVKALLRLEDGQSCAATRAVAGRKLASIEARMADLRRMRRTLSSLIAGCDSGGRPRRCPIIATLADDSAGA
jgi:MerR family mercuric resistance operon transcriptional regulator